MELKVTKANALLAHSKAGKEAKTVLENLFGQHNFRTITDESQKAFEQACEKLKLKPEEVLPFSNATTERQIRANAREMLDVIAESIKLGLPELDFNNSNQKKWFVVFKKSDDGVGFVVSNTGYHYTDTNTHVGSRLSFHESDTAYKFGNDYLDLHNLTL